MRIATRIASALLALALLAGGLLAAVEIAAAALGREKPVVLPWDDWRRTALDTPWSDFEVRAVMVGLIVLGLLLLFLLLIRRRPVAVPLASRTAGSESELDRSGLERWLVSRVRQVDGVGDAKVRVRDTRVKVSATTPASETAAVRRGVEASAEESLRQLDLAKTPPVRVAISSPRET